MRDPDYIHRYSVGSLNVRKLPILAALAVKFLELVNNPHPLARKRVILVMPVVLGFQIGRLVGSIAKFYLFSLGE